jgi:hypothetical protein
MVECWPSACAIRIVDGYLPAFDRNGLGAIIVKLAQAGVEVLPLVDREGRRRGIEAGVREGQLLGDTIDRKREMRGPLCAHRVVKEACLKALGLGLWPWIRKVRLRACHSPRTTNPNVKAFAASIGRIGMIAVTVDIEPCLLGIAYRASYELGSIQLHLDGETVVLDDAAAETSFDRRMGVRGLPPEI